MSYDPGPTRRSGMDGFFTNYFVLAIILAICCNLIALILGIIGIVTCTDPLAKRNATIVTVIAAIMFVVGIIINFTMGGLQMLQQR